MLFSFWTSKNPGKTLEKTVKQPWKTLDFSISEDVRTLSMFGGRGTLAHMDLCVFDNALEPILG